MSKKNTTNFQKVMIFNRAFDMVSNEPSEYNSYSEDSQGNIMYSPLKHIRKELFMKSKNIIRLRLDLIKEEIFELNDAIKDNNIIEQRDACADILYVVYGMCDVLGISIDDIFNNTIKDIITKLHSDNLYYFENSVTEITNKGEYSLSNFNYIKYFINDIINFYINIDKNINYTIQNNKTDLISIINTNLHILYSELNQNCYNDDLNINISFENIAVNLIDLLIFTYMFTVVLGVNADEDFSIVHESNMSKLCDTEEDAKSTVNDYSIKYLTKSSPYDSPYYYYLPNLDKWIVKNLSSGKALKNIKYKKVCFE